MFEPTLRPLIALKGGKSRGYAIDCGLRGARSARTVLRRLAASDVERVDLAALDAGLKALAAREERVRAPLLVLPAAFATFNSKRGRAQLLEHAAFAREALQATVILEVTSLPTGLAASRLVDLIGLIRPACEAVFVRIRPGKGVAAALDGCTLNGVAMEACDLDAPEDGPAMIRLLLILRMIGPTVMLHNLRSMAAIHAAREAGATYASFDLTHMSHEMPETAATK